MNNYYGNSWQSQAQSGPFISTRTANAFMQRVFTIMAMGLAITGLTAYGVSLNYDMMAAIFTTNLRWVVMLAPLAFILVLSFGLERMSYFAATLTFVGYCLVMGLSLSAIFLIYTSASIATTFFVTAGTFGAMAFYGYTTKTDLTKMGSYLMMGLIGIIIASVVNWFVGSSTLHYVISFIGVLIFTGLTAYDTQKMIQISQQVDHDSEAGRKASLIGALSLYLDFVLLFQYLLTFLGDRE